MKKIKNLILDQDFEVNNSYPNIFIHPFCSKIKKKDNDIVLDYPWSDYSKFKKDYIYSQSLLSKILDSSAKLLNDYHKTKFSKKFWEIELGKWMHSYCYMFLERWEILKKLDEFEEDFLVSIKKFSDDSMVMQTSDELGNNYFLKDYNSYLFNKIFEFKYASSKKFKVNFFETNKSEIIDTRKRFRTYENSIKKKLILIYSKLFSPLLKKQKYSILRSYLSYRENIVLNLKLKQLPMFVGNNYYLCEPDLKLRSKLKLNISPTNEFEKFIYFNFSLFLPVSALEGFKLLDEKIDKYHLPKRPKKIFTSNIHGKSLLSRYCAKKIESGSKLILGEHGGSYGVYDILFHDYFENKISDIRLNWGNDKNDNIKNKSVGIIRPLPILEKKSEKKFLTLIIPTVPLYSNQFESHIPMIHNNNFIFNPCFKIIDHLNDNIKNNDLIIRFIPRNFGLNEYEVFEKKYPKIKKDLQKISYENILSNTKIFLSPYLGTGFLETLSMNIPTIIINSKYNENIINNHVKEVFEDLKKVKIFFDNEIDLTNHINSIWENPRNWWENKNLQNARISFCERFAFKNDNKLNDLKNIIIE